jgi:homoserine O-acetyltransferase
VKTNRHLESLPTDARRAGERDSARAAPVREELLTLHGEASLHHGGSLPGLRIAWRLVGPAGAPIVAALGGISANRRVCGAGEGPAGWWEQIVGEGRALDTERFRILSFDFLGGSGESSGPDPGSEFPSVSTYDQAELLLRLMHHLRIASLHAIAGGSYGGMVALAFAERYPDRVARLLVIGAADAPHPMATAWRSTQRRIVRFALEAGDAGRGLELARALAMATYRSAEEFAARFDGAPVREGGRFVFPVERYLAARGREFAGRHRAEAFLCLSESIDLHRVDAARIHVPTTVVAVREDQLVPLSDMRAMVARLARGRLHELSSVYGHDAFLKEAEQLRPLFRAALEGAP